MKEKTLKRLSYTILTGPSIFIFAAAIVFPILFSFVLSFTEYSGTGYPTFIGFKNYIDMFSDEIFLHGIRNNLLIVAVSVLGQIPLGFVLAYILYRNLVKGRNFFEAMIFLPITISIIIVAILFNRFFSTAGIFPALMRIITGNPRWVFWMQADKIYAIVPILFVLLWMYTGLYMIIFANLQKI